MGHVAGEAEDVHFRGGSRLLAACCARAAWNSIGLGLAVFRSLDPQTAAFPETRRWRRRSKNEGPRLLRFPSFHAIGHRPRLCLLASVLPAASEVRVLAGQAGLIRPSTGVSGVRSERLDAV